jgi:hypothetical protein
VYFHTLLSSDTRFTSGEKINYLGFGSEGKISDALGIEL